MVDSRAHWRYTVFMKALATIFLAFAIAGLWGHYEVTVISITMLVILRHAEKVFAKQDREWKENRVLTVRRIEEELEEQSCSFM